MRAYAITPVTRTYRNNGQHLEQCFRFHMTGEIVKADNHMGTDLWDIQIKSARATICRGDSIESFVATDVAQKYVYITKGYVAYEMSKAEYVAFASEFATCTYDSKKNGKSVKMRFGHETKKLLNWLDSQLGQPYMKLTEIATKTLCTLHKVFFV